LTPPRTARLLLTLLATASIAATPLAQAWADPRTAGLRPDPTSDEGGLWGQSDKAEAAARSKAELNKDPALTGYVQGVACKVAAEYCKDIRVYVMDRPFFNASMAPNGYMEVWSGLMLRARSESELAFVLGHESSHYSHGHSLAAWRAMKSRANTATVLSAVVMVAGVAAGAGTAGNTINSIMDAANAVSDILYLAAIASFFAFSREQESEADRLGLEAAVKAGYDPAAGAAIWRSLTEETASSDFEKTRRQQTSGSIFASHPVTSDRIAALDKLAAGRPAPAGSDRARYRAAIRPFIGVWLKDDLRRRDYGQTLHLINRMAADGEDLGVLGFYKGETYRRRRLEGDQALAMAAYLDAAKQPDAPVATWRELGDLQMKAGQADQARASYDTYLAKAPTAQDRWIVEANLKKLTGASGT
jgi:predicted Zn-dependent protease